MVKSGSSNGRRAGGGGISATFNAPITGVFFGVEIILREFSIEAILAVMLGWVTSHDVMRAVATEIDWPLGHNPVSVTHADRPADVLGRIRMTPLVGVRRPPHVCVAQRTRRMSV